MFVQRKLEYSSSSPIQRFFVWSAFLFVCLLFGWLIIYFFLNSHLDMGIHSVSFYFLIAILLMPLNILCESFKLYYKLHSSISLFKLTRQVCKGFTFSIFFPLGLGPYLGRAFFVREKKHGEIIKITAISSLTQSLCNLGFGLLLGYPLLKNMIHWNPMFILISSLLSLGVIFLGIIGIHWMDQTENSLLYKLKSWLKNKFSFSTIRITKQDWIIYSGLSFVRYVIYCLQCILILMSFSDMDIFQVISVAALFFMVLSLIYLPGILSVLSRAAIACVLFSYIGLENDQAIYCSWFIFLLNIAVPAMLGFFFLFEDTIQTE